MQPIFVAFIIASVLWLAISIIRLKKRRAMAPLSAVVGYGIVPGISLLFVVLAESHLLPFSFYFVGAFLIIAVGGTFIVRGVTKSVDLDEMLLKVYPVRFNPDRIFFEKFGKPYFYFKSILIGVIFVVGGIMVMFRKI